MHAACMICKYLLGINLRNEAKNSRPSYVTGQTGIFPYRTHAPPRLRTQPGQPPSGRQNFF